MIGVILFFAISAAVTTACAPSGDKNDIYYEQAQARHHGETGDEQTAQDAALKAQDAIDDAAEDEKDSYVKSAEREEIQTHEMSAQSLAAADPQEIHSSDPRELSSLAPKNSARSPKPNQLHLHSEKGASLKAVGPQQQIHTIVGARENLRSKNGAPVVLSSANPSDMEAVQSQTLREEDSTPTNRGPSITDSDPDQKINLAYNEELMKLGKAGQKDMSVVCGGGKILHTNMVTHYYVPEMNHFNEFTCHQMEGTCHFKQKGEWYIANYGKKSMPLRDARCKSGYGYGLPTNCVHPCRTLAANKRFHKPGEVIFFPNLVGMKCGTGKNAMIHDGFMVVNDTGSPTHFNREGRFDFFWGECKKFGNGLCYDGGIPISQSLSTSRYCRVWRTQDPTRNVDAKLKVYAAINQEARQGDDGNASVASLETWINYHTREHRKH